MSFTSVGIPQRFAPPGPGAIGVSLQIGENRPVASQLPVRRALRKIDRLRPVRYRKCTATVAIDAPAWRHSSLSFGKIISARSDDAIPQRTGVVTMAPDRWTAH